MSGCFGSRLWCGVFHIRTLPLILLMSSVVAAGAEVHISFAALERMLASQIFTDEGRRYVRGSRTEKCNFAWLENRGTHDFTVPSEGFGSDWLLILDDASKGYKGLARSGPPVI